MHVENIRSIRRRRRQRGASLLEGIAYLGIAAIVVMGAISLLTGAFSSAKSNQANEEVIGLRTAVRKLYMGQTYGTADMAANLITAKAAPGTLAVNGTSLRNGWGGTVTLVGSGAGFAITYPDVPKDVCVSMLSGASGWTSVKTNDGTAIETFPLTVADATSQCSANDNTIVYTSS
jgi:outer membrane murein-binding lipoprotein Lpp